MTIRPEFPIYLLVMAGVTYLIRMLPLLLVRHQIKNRFILSFLYYVPYAVLSAMVIPSVFSSTGSVITAAAGLVAAIVLALLNRSLITVALGASAAAFLTGLIV